MATEENKGANHRSEGKHLITQGEVQRNENRLFRSLMSETSENTIFVSVLLRSMLSLANLLRAGQPDRPVKYRVRPVEPRGLPITLPEKSHFGCLEEIKVVTRFP